MGGVHGEVDVAVDEAGRHGVAGQVDDAGPRGAGDVWGDLGDPAVLDEDLGPATQAVGAAVEVGGANEDGAWIADGDGHGSSLEGVGFGVTRGCETGTFKLKRTPAMRTVKQIAAATMAIAPL